MRLRQRCTDSIAGSLRCSRYVTNKLGIRVIDDERIHHLRLKKTEEEIEKELHNSLEPVLILTIGTPGTLMGSMILR